MSKHKRRNRKYYRKNKVADRYDITTRTVDRWSKDGSGRLPPPVYLPGIPFPLWAEDQLDEHDQKATLGSRPH